MNIKTLRSDRIYQRLTAIRIFACEKPGISYAKELPGSVSWIRSGHNAFGCATVTCKKLNQGSLCFKTWLMRST